MGIPTSPFNNATSINTIFQNLLARNATGGEVTFWTNVDAGPGGDAAVLTGIEDLPEAVNLSEAVIRFYEAAFGREPDLAGFAGWVAALRSGVSQIAVAEGFTHSVEFIARYGSNNVTPGLISAY